MSKISMLDQETINKIAAGEVIERPSAVVKELVENAIDAGANAITIEIKEGGIQFIRITDNGSGIAKEDIPLAFKRHSTSKIKSVEDLLSVSSLGFRGEALSSIAAVAQVELVTKSGNDVTGIRYLIEGGMEKSVEEIGCPEGTTFIIRNIFFNTPARRKFLKTAATEAGYINELVERLAVSHPNISFKFINNNQMKLHTSGNDNLKDIIYHVYGRDITAQLLQVGEHSQQASVSGFVAKPVVSRGNRNYMNYYINGRYIKSGIISKAIEDAYKPYTMTLRYPFVVLHFQIDQSFIDVNVHPTKMEIRFSNSQEIYNLTYETITNALKGKELIPEIETERVEKKTKLDPAQIPEPFERKRMEMEKSRESVQTGRREQMGRPLQFGSSEKTDKSELSGRIVPICEQEQTGRIVPTGKSELTGRPELTGMSEQNQSTERTGKFKQTINLEENGFLGTVGKPGEIEKSDYSDKPNQKLEQTEKTEWSEKAEWTKQTDAIEERVKSYSIEGNMPEQSDRSEIDMLEEKLQLNSQTTSSSEPFIVRETEEYRVENPVQQTLFEDKVFSESARKEHKIIGQLFLTYWLVEYHDKLFIIDQHAAHEKVLFEQTMDAIKKKEIVSQQIHPAIILTLNMREEQILKEYQDTLQLLGFEIEHFGGKEYAVTALPGNLPHMAEKELLLEFIDDLEEVGSKHAPDILMEKVASMSCKAAVKGNYKLSALEAESLIDELLTLENPYHCPHGRPTIISMSKYEMEKKFKRIV